MQQLKPISKSSIPKALIRAKHYRLLNEPWQAESICRDILKVKPGHQRALLYLILAITDRFGNENTSSFSVDAKELCTQLTSEFEQKYYNGIIEERLGRTSLLRNIPRAKYIAYEHYRLAMKYFEDSILKQHPDCLLVESFRHLQNISWQGGSVHRQYILHEVCFAIN
jgi:hypothetical protein